MLSQSCCLLHLCIGVTDKALVNGTTLNDHFIMETLHLVIGVTVNQENIALIKGKALWDTYGHLKMFQY